MNKSTLFTPNFNQHTPAPNSAPALPSREEIADEYKWNLTDIYHSEDEFNHDIQSLKKLISEMTKYKNTLNTPKNLIECLNLQDSINMKASTLFAYARMSRDTDAKNSHYQAITAQMESLLADAASSCAFIEPELLALPEKDLKSMLMTVPDLQIYQFYLRDLLRQNQHVLSSVEEELLAKASDLMQAPSNIYTILTNADLTFPKTLNEKGEQVQLSEGRYNSLIRSANRDVRQSAFAKLFGTYAQYRNTFATTFSSNVKNTIFQAKVKKYSSTLHAALDNTNVSTEIYTNLISTIQQNLQPLHAYVDLKREFLHLDNIHMYDLYVPLTKETTSTYPYDSGLQLVIDSLKPLGEQYIKDLTSGAASGWIDRYETQGKRTGAYSWGVYGIHPFVLLNYDGQYGSVSTLAHELGHAMHSYYSNKNQKYINASYTIFCAEVASTTNELLLLEHMMQIEKDPAHRIYFINQYLEQVRTTVYRQTMFAEFELITHSKAEAGEALTADLLEAIWLELNRKYYGNKIILDDEIKIEWARIPHFYRPFYVYQYATGYAAATALADNLKTKGDSAQQQYLDYLKSGGSAYSIDLLKKAGVDMRNAAPIEITLSKFAEKLAELQFFLGKA